MVRRIWSPAPMLDGGACCARVTPSADGSSGICAQQHGSGARKHKADARPWGGKRARDDPRSTPSRYASGIPGTITILVPGRGRVCVLFVDHRITGHATRSSHLRRDGGGLRSAVHRQEHQHQHLTPPARQCDTAAFAAAAASGEQSTAATGMHALPPRGLFSGWDEGAVFVLPTPQRGATTTAQSSRIIRLAPSAPTRAPHSRISARPQITVKTLESKEMNISENHAAKRVHVAYKSHKSDILTLKSCQYGSY